MSIFPPDYKEWNETRQSLFRDFFNVDETGAQVSGPPPEPGPFALCKTVRERKIYLAIWAKYGKHVPPSEFDKYPLD